ncbi:ribonuclease E activity regulator RraA [Microvirga brassicacearum]|uniref:4-hydroxy-4-methyl-2-oxoglutarate aldolase n=1 Tax=Microvirga brassicacearum TaxID=2580413 RepID=A0A5N3PGL5_9HYPH|nr:ribonuclease E activity regulator RraA [Microvirga brassicacearum]KAB0268882.1 ribonuclease E activity regulator RraA [Microvirga brassicacearum]
MPIKTADLVDTHDAETRFCHLPLRLFGRRRFFHGRIATLRTFEDNVILKRRLEQDGEGQVLVVDGGGSTRCAIIGDQIAAIGHKNRWAGIIVNGALRDVAEIGAMEFGIFALGHSPKKSTKLRIGTEGGVVTFGNVDFTPGHWVYADDDGILVAPRAIHEDARG